MANDNPANNLSDEDRSKGGQHSGGQFKTGSQRTKAAAKKGGQSSSGGGGNNQ
jgi:general stress protein YciG